MNLEYGEKLMNIKLLTDKDLQQLHQYLLPHQSECMFICSNLKDGGIVFRQAPYQGEYVGFFNDKTNLLEGVIVHYWNGNIIMYASNVNVLAQLTLYFKKHINRPVVGILGPNAQAEYVINFLGCTNKRFSINSNEGLYEIELFNICTPNLPHDYEIVKIEQAPEELITQWLKAYHIEALGSTDNNELDEEIKEDARRIIDRNDCWILLVKGIPVSLSAFNARLEKIVQVGPVWTPPLYRKNGYATLLLTHILAHAKDNGITKAVLFTNNEVAINVYQKIGFKKIGNFRLAIFEKPLELKNF